MVALIAPLTPQEENDPDLEGEFGSNQTEDELAHPEPGDAGEPWSHYLNPWAHPGVARLDSLELDYGVCGLLWHIDRLHR